MVTGSAKSIPTVASERDACAPEPWGASPGFGHWSFVHLGPLAEVWPSVSWGSWDSALCPTCDLQILFPDPRGTDQNSAPDHRHKSGQKSASSGSCCCSLPWHSAKACDCCRQLVPGPEGPPRPGHCCLSSRHPGGLLATGALPDPRLGLLLREEVDRCPVPPWFPAPAQLLQALGPGSLFLWRDAPPRPAPGFISCGWGSEALGTRTSARWLATVRRLVFCPGPHSTFSAQVSAGQTYSLVPSSSVPSAVGSEGLGWRWMWPRHVAPGAVCVLGPGPGARVGGAP